MNWSEVSQLKWVQAIKAHLRRESFNPGAMGLVLNPAFIIRRGLWLNVSRLAPAIVGRILDFGCGSRPYECLFVNASEYIGLDMERTGHDHVNSKVDVSYDGETIPFEAGEFDAVVSFEVFEHIFNLDLILGEIHRVLRDDGKLLITVPFIWPEHEQPFDFARYTSFGMRSILERNGFKIEELVKSGHFTAAIWQAFVSYLFVNFSPKRSLVGRGIFQVLVIFPIMSVGLFASALLPRRYQAYCNLVVLAQKQSLSSPGTTCQ